MSMLVFESYFRATSLKCHLIRIYSTVLKPNCTVEANLEAVVRGSRDGNAGDFTRASVVADTFDRMVTFSRCGIVAGRSAALQALRDAVEGWRAGGISRSITDKLPVAA